MIVDIRFIPYEYNAQLGLVEVSYDDGTIDSFSRVSRGKFYRWARYDFLDEDCPAQVELRDEEELEDDDDNDDDELHLGYEFALI